MVGSAGVTAMDKSWFTLRVALVAVIPRAVAVIDVVPGPTAVAMPETGSIVATAVLDDAQLTLNPWVTLPLL